MRRRYHLPLALLAIPCVLGVLAASADPTPVSQNTAVEIALGKAGEREDHWRKFLADQRADADRLEAASFLIAHMPVDDLKKLSTEFLEENISVALEARNAVPWGKTIPTQLFLNDVLPYASVNERRDNWRKDFFEKFLPVVKDCKSPAEAADKLNREMFGMVGVKYSTKRRKADQSPYESIETGLASCSGLSILLTNACRSVCIPSRIVGTPLWKNKRGNHTWVEMWDQDWHFAGACEPDKNGLDRGWFAGAAGKADSADWCHGIYAVSYGPADLEGPFMWWQIYDPEKPFNHLVDVTARYAKVEKIPGVEGGQVTAIRVLEKKKGSRTKVSLAVFDASGKALAKGKSRDETSDANDLFEVRLVPGEAYRLDLSWKDGPGIVQRSEELKAAEKAGGVVEYFVR